jgi:hypothetical protein
MLTRCARAVQAQGVSIARALAVDPLLLLLDDPSPRSPRRTSGSAAPRPRGRTLPDDPHDDGFVRDQPRASPCWPRAAVEEATRAKCLQAAARGDAASLQVQGAAGVSAVA